MAETKLIRDHHLLTRNLKLNDNYLSNDGGDEGIRIDNDGKVGIGIDDPDGLLHVKGDDVELFYHRESANNTPPKWRFRKSRGDDTAANAGDYCGMIGFDFLNTATPKTWETAGDLIVNVEDPSSGTEDGSMAFRTMQNGYLTTSVYMDQNGRVGIGDNSSPKSALDVRGPVGTGAGSAGVLTFTTKETTIRSGTADQLGRIDFQAPDEEGGTDARLVGASIYAECEEDFASDTNSTALVFATGRSSAPIERLRIDYDGIIRTPTVDLYNGAIYLKNPADTADYARIAVATGGATTFITVDDGGNNDASLNFQPQGDITYRPAANQQMTIIPTTRTASGTQDNTLKLAETLNLPSGADGSDVHYGLWYAQTQTDLTGWDDVYLMYLTGGTSAKTFSVDSNANLACANIDSSGTIDCEGKLFVDINDSTANDNVTNNGVHIDIDNTGLIGSGKTITSTGLDLDITRSGSIHPGSTTNQVGIDLDLVGTGDGTSTNIGIDINVGSADTNYALITSGGNVGITDSAPIGTLSVGGTIAITAESTTPSQPADGKGYIYSKAGGGLYWRSYDLTELSLSGGAADGLTAVQPADTFYIGTTSIAHNRGSGALTLAGITLTTPDIGTPSAGTLTNCTFPTLNQSTTGTAAIATTVTLTDNESTDEANPLWFSAGAAGSGNIAPEADGDLYYNPSSGILGTKGLKLSYNGSNYADITVADDGEIEIANTASGSTGDITLDSAGDIRLQAEEGDIFMSQQTDLTTSSFLFNVTDEPRMIVRGPDAVTADWFSLEVFTNGETHFNTIDGAGNNANLIFDIDGRVNFDGCAVGFTKQETNFAHAAVTSESDDSTDIDFRKGNKHELTLDDNIGGSGENINMVFPGTSGNFILVICQDGTGGRTVAADGWKAYNGLSLANNTLSANLTDGDVRWAGGEAPTLSTGARAVDVISIYWDIDTQTALAVASLNFATPS